MTYRRRCRLYCTRLLCCSGRYMYRCRIPLILLVITLLYLYSQYNVLSRVSQNQSTDKLPTQETIAYRNTKDVVTSCAASGLDLILLDVDILQAILDAQNSKISERNRGSKCRFLCSAKSTVTTLAVLENSWHLGRGLMSRLSELGFEIMELKSRDPRLLAKSFNDKLNTRLESITAEHFNDKWQQNGSEMSRLSVHYLIWRADHVVQVVVLHERPGPFLWFSKARFTHAQKQWLERVELDASRLKLGEFDGALPIFQISHVKIDGLSLLAPKYPRKLLDDLRNSRYEECNYDKAAQFYQRFPRDNSLQAHTFRSRVENIILKTKTILDEMHIPFWLSSGTCLGWFRQCDVISYSLDVDIGIQIEHYHQDIITNLEQSGLHFHYKFGKLEDSLQLAFLLDKVKLDIYFFYKEGELVWNGGTHARTGNKFRYLFPRFDLCWTWFVGVLVRVPCETEVYVEANYGEGWDTPVTEWSWRQSPPNIRPNGQWPRHEWDDVIQIFE